MIELKNTEDRYIVQQLTRYYHSLKTYRPFADQIDYGKPIHLLAIAPTFHKHNQIDRQYSQLHYQLACFRITQLEAENYQFNLTDRDTAQAWNLVIPKKFNSCIATKFDNSPKPVHQLTLPPKSLQRIIQSISSNTQARVIEIRNKILSFDEQIREVGLTTTTKYGLAKGDKDVYEGKLCAEFLLAPIVISGRYQPRLLLRLPYPKKKLTGLGRTYNQQPTKGMTFAEVASGECWDSSDIYFYLGKSRTNWSWRFTLKEYANVYQQLTKKQKSLDSLDALIDLALEEWEEQIKTSQTE